ncbi:MAG TPA: MFS transporter [Rhizomicrobium sp.]|jgi:DHA2 family methylenomycin A resistance protein-like MFS transporter|nr:MFS transporter [Rhizomicrobium sp.]
MNLATPATHGIGWIVLAASFGFALIQLDVTIVNVALPSIANAFGAHVAELQWVVDAYAVCFAALLLSAGFLGDRFGARRIYLSGMALFAAASLACGLAPEPVMLIAARAVQGVGAAVMLPCSLALLNHATEFDPAVRAKAVGWWTASGGITIAAGPLVGGLMLSVFGWRSIFLVNIPLCVLGALLALKLAETERAKTRHGFDIAGQALAILSLIAITATIIEAKLLGFGGAVLPGMAAVGIAAFVAFLLVEARSKDPMLPLPLFANRAFRTAICYGFIVNLTYYGIVFVLSLYLQRVLDFSPLKAGLAYLPLTATFFVVNIISGSWVARAGSRPPMIIGALIDAAGFGLLALLAAKGFWALLPAFILMPGGMGLGVPAMTTAVLAAIDKRMSGIAAGVLNAARQAGGACGVALFGALAGDQPADIAAGLHGSAMVAIALLLLAALMAVQIASRLDDVR